MVAPQLAKCHRILKASTYVLEIGNHVASPPSPTTSCRPRQGLVEVGGLATNNHIAFEPQH